jgi:hypothetical protein
MIVAGIDSDKDGCIAVLETMKTPVLYPMPIDGEGELDCNGILDLCRYLKEQNAIVAMEQVHAFPPSMGGSLTNFSRGQMRMAWKMAGMATGLVINEVPAATWKKHHEVLVPIIKAGRTATEREKKVAYKLRKVKALAKARDLFGLAFKGPKGGDRVSQAEACLLAQYAMDQWITGR